MPFGVGANSSLKEFSKELRRGLGPDVDFPGVSNGPGLGRAAFGRIAFFGGRSVASCDAVGVVRSFHSRIPNMYAVIRAGGKQYRVSEKDTLIVEKLDGEVGDSITLGDVLFLGGDAPKIGAPTVSGASVTATIVRQGKGKKIHGLTYIKVKGHQRHYGHRQFETHLRIDSING
jgi:large subunit ribosomal protein L21